MLANKSITRLVQKYPATVYCLLVFLITWGLKYWYALVRTENYLPPVALLFIYVALLA